jgi:hypothetical protein
MDQLIHEVQHMVSQTHIKDSGKGMMMMMMMDSILTISIGRGVIKTSKRDYSSKSK